MSFVTFPRAPRDGRPQRSIPFRPAVELLEDRSVPATLISNGDNTQEGADAPVVVLGASEDGNYLLLQSTATNLVPNQIDSPGSVDLFWFDQTTGTRRLITAFDPPATSSVLAGSKSLGASISTPGVSLKAMISGDGQSVGFISGVDAALFDNTLPVTTDGGGEDMFVWSAATGRNTLISFNAARTSLGTFASVSNPAISFSGGSASFLSTANMFSSFDAKFIDDSLSPDIFRADVGSTPVPVTYFRTKLADGSIRFPSYGPVTVDPLNRYTGGALTSFSALSSSFGSFFFGPGFGFGASSVDANRWTFASGLNIEPLFVTLSTSVSGNTLSGEGGEVFNVIVARDRPDIAMFVARGPNTPSANLVPGYVNQNSSSYDLYRSSFETGSLAVSLVSAESGSATRGANGILDTTPGGYGLTPSGTRAIFTSTATNLAANVTDKNRAFDIFQRNLDTATTTTISVLSSNSNRTGNAASTLPSFTSDGILVAFQSLANNLSPVTDANGVSDVYVRDIAKNTTALASAVPGNFNSGNARSFGPVIGGSFRSGKLYFTSDANNLVRNFTVVLGSSQVYQALTPIQISNLSRQVAISGGTNGLVTLGRLDLDGNIVTGTNYEPFPGWRGDVRVATGDVNGDGVLDIIAGVGPGGGPRVVVIDGANGEILTDFFAFEETFTGGVYVAASDLNADGRAEIIIGAGEGGGPRVQIYDGATETLLVDQFAYEGQARTGVRVSTGDFNFDGLDEIVVSAGIGGGPRIRVFDGRQLPNFVTLADFFAFEPTQRGGTYISAGDFDGDGKADIVAGAGPDGGPRVSVFNAANIVLQDPNKRVKLLDFFAFDAGSRDGARAVLRDIDGDNIGDLVIGSGNGFPRVRTYRGGISGGPSAPLQLTDTVPFNELFGSNGAWVG